MSSAGSTLRTRVLEACRAATVAAQAGVASATWASPSVRRVFSGLAGLQGGRNRGRLPFLEVDITGQTTELLSEEGGSLTQRVVVRCHVGGSDIGEAGDLTEAILSACATQIRRTDADNLTVLGDEDLGQLQDGPWGLSRDLTLSVAQSFARSDYGVT